jgi:hypothetical protein
MRGIWPPLMTAGFAANIVSAGCMAGAVVVIACIAADLGVGRWTAAVIIALFALDPMIVLYGANGLSEAPFMLFLLLASRYLIDWWRTDRTSALAAAGFALALAYLTRYEAVAAAGGVILIVGLRIYLRSGGSWRTRMSWAGADMIVVGLPFAFTFLGWAIASWVITGSAFATFSSVYGNSSQVALAGSSIAATTGQGLDALRFAFGEILGLAPALPIVIGIAAVISMRRRRTEMLIPLAIFGSVLMFAILTTVGGASFAWLRFSITAIPLSIVLAMLALAPARSPAFGPATATSLEPTPRRSTRWAEAALSVAVILMVAVSLPIGISTMTDPRIGREEAEQVRALLSGSDPTMTYTVPIEIGAAAARYIDGLGLPDGSVIVDVAVGFPIVLQSGHPRQFVITPDRDFQRILADPATFAARYLLVPFGSGYSSLDAVGRAYPTMFHDGAGIARRVAEFGSGIFAWRLYRLD